jgi:hypothetical protein
MVKTEKRILRIINSDGHSMPMDYWVADWQSIIGWIDNKNLAISLSLDTEDYQKTIILNPFTGAWKNLELSQWLKENPPQRTVYNPTFGWLLDYSYFPSPHRVLKDFKTGNIIWQNDQGGSFAWSRDGSTMIVNSASLMDRISKRGQVTEFDIKKLEMESWGDLELSPNGERLFFSAYYPERFFFLDIKKSIIHELCRDDYEMRTYISRPFWSPDNRFLVLGVYDSNSYPVYNSFDVLIDTEQLHAYKLVTRRNHERLAWLAKP